MKKFILLICFAFFSITFSFAQINAGDVPVGWSAVNPGISISVATAGDSAHAYVDLNCDSAPDLSIVMRKGQSSIDEPNTVLIYNMTSFEVCEDTSLNEVTFYAAGDPLCTSPSAFVSRSFYVVACYGSLGCASPPTQTNTYIAYRNSLTNDIGWIQISYNLNDAGGATTPIILAVDTILQSCLQTAITDQSEENLLSCFPNPANDEVNISSAKLIQSVRIINLSGEICKNEIADGYTTKVNIQELPKGIYFIAIALQEKVIYRKLIKN